MHCCCVEGEDQVALREKVNTRPTIYFGHPATVHTSRPLADFLLLCDTHACSIAIIDDLTIDDSTFRQPVSQLTRPVPPDGPAPEFPARIATDSRQLPYLSSSFFRLSRRRAYTDDGRNSDVSSTGAASHRSTPHRRILIAASSPNKHPSHTGTAAESRKRSV